MLPINASTAGSRIDRLLKHAILMCGLLRDILDRIPVLDNFPVVEPEAIENRTSPGIRHTHGMHVNDDVIPIGKDAFYFAMRLRKILLQHGKKRLESFLAVTYERIMLLIVGAYIF